MNNFSTMQGEVLLPSKGAIYNTQVDPNVILRSMTTQEEMIRLSPSENAFSNLCQMIDKCIVNDIGISSYDLCLGDYLALLYQLRCVTYGKEYKLVSRCPLCGHTSTNTIDLTQLNRIEYNAAEINEYREFTLPVCNKTVTIKFQTPRILDAIKQKQKEFVRKHKDLELNYELIITLTTLIDSIDGKKYDPVSLEEWLKGLSMKDTNELLQKAAKLNSLIGIDTITTAFCDLCGNEYNVQLSADSEFFRPALG